MDTAPTTMALPRRGLRRAVLLVLGMALFLGFVSLGTWQVQRRTWKLDLIERVDQRVHAAPVALPPVDQWPGISAAQHEYLPVIFQGRWLPGKTVLAQAVTELGAGFWVMTALQQDDGTQVLVNRGFVPQEQRAQWLEAPPPPDGTATVQGLLRMTEPGGGFLRTNDPAQQRWYSRDVAAISRTLGLPRAAPFFVDAGLPGTAAAPSAASGWPRAGLTVIRFHNSHLVYALTWYGLALMVVVAGWYVARYERRMGARAASRLPTHDEHPPTTRPDPALATAPRNARSADAAAGIKNLQQLIELRWIAVVGQVFTIEMAHYSLGLKLPLQEMLLVVGCLAVFNVVSLLRLRTGRAVRNVELFLALLIDVAVLTVQLYLSGGTSNPFVFLYLLQITLGAVLLRGAYIWSIVIITVLCFAALADHHLPLALPQDLHQGLSSLYVLGLLVCFVLNATLVMVFITRIHRNLRERDARLAAARRRRVEEEHIVRMGLLASGAAHELGTPLSTLAVILGDWQHDKRLTSNAALKEDIAEMQTQVQRCKSIVSGILLSAGETRGEASVQTTVRKFVDALAEEWRSTRTIPQFDYDNDFGTDTPMVSDTTLKQMVFNVLDNARDASPGWVRLAVTRNADALCMTVTDAGPGFAPDMLSKLGTPYQSSKNRPGGGLGLYLVLNVARTLGGSVEARNRPEGGAQVTIELPLASIALPQKV